MTTHDTAGAIERGALTLTQVLELDTRLSLYGQGISDISPHGDLGLGLDPEGPVGFALIRGFRHRGRFRVLAVPLVLSVFGEGYPPGPADRDALAGERLWDARLSDRALHLGLHCGSLGALLGATGEIDAATRPVAA